MPIEKPFKTLILCTGNSARSIIGEYLLRSKSRGRFEAYSAGVQPRGKVNPLAIWVLKDRYGIDAADARSKSWEEFKDVKFDFVITVCDNARESCPDWPGQPVIAHWSSPDPAAVEGTDEQKKAFFTQIAMQLALRIELLCDLPDHELKKLHLERIAAQTPFSP
ncbi:MAG: arsenate reductase ArsC [Opitutaceae bacterium]|jgi:protein-tyrosine-phosphatase